MPSSNKKRSGGGGIFDAVDALDSQDTSAERKKRRTTEQAVRSSKAAQSQVKLYNHLMELRILLQRVQGGEGGEGNEEQYSQLLQQLVTARSTLMGRTAEPLDDDSDDEETLADEYNQLQGEWKTVLNKRYKELRLHAGLTAKAQFKLLDSDFWQQVESTTDYELNQQSEAFDDAKLYQHLLQDFLVGRSKTGAQDALEKRRKKKSSKKTNVDRKASKGRKTRYTVIPKLVNFTFPLERPESGSTMDQDEWFKSLFGGQKQR